MIDLELRVIEGPCLHLVGPGQVHQLERSPDMEGVVVMFANTAELDHGHDARAELFSYTNMPRAIGMSESRINEATDLALRIEQELARPEGALTEVIDGFLGILLIKCLHWARETPEGTNPLDADDTIHRFMELVEKGFLEERSVTHYAGLLSISPDHLNERVKERTGRTASSVIQQRLLLESKRLLLHADMSIKEVGYALNMKDPAYFSRWFNKAEGMPPAAYRTRVREKYKH